MKNFLAICCFAFFVLEGKALDSLSVQDAIQKSLFNNFQIQISKKNVEIAKNNNNAGEAGKYPMVLLRLPVGNMYQERNNPTQPFANGTYKTNSVSPNLDAGWTIFEGFKAQMTQEKLMHLEEQSVGNSKLIVQNTIQSTILAYYNVVLEQKKIDILKETYLLSKSKYDYENDRKKMGLSTTFELLQEKTAMLSDSINYVTQVLNLKNSFRNLNLLMAIPTELEYKITIDSLEDQMVKYEYEELEKKLLSNNQNFQNQLIYQKIMQADLGISKSALYPKLNLNVGADYNYIHFNRSGQSLISNNWDIYANVTLTFTLFNGGKVRRQIENSSFREEIAQLQTKEVEFQITKELHAQHDLYELYRNQIQILDENLKTATLQLKLAEERLKNGTINSIDYRNIQLNQRNVGLMLYSGVFNLIQAKVEIMRLTGVIVE